MTIQEIRLLIQRYLDLIELGRGSVEADEKALAEILDRLAVAVHDAPPGDVTDDADAPGRSYEELRSEVVARFPNYGFYVCGQLLKPGEDVPEGMIGDAIDDITDIALELYKTVWLWENLSPSDGLWMFHFSFESHWGEHLRGLQAYLHLAGR